MTTNANVFRAGSANISDLAALRFQWRTEEGGEKGLSREGFELKFFEWFEKHRESHRAYVATIDGKPVGCAWLFVVERIPGPEKFVRRAGMVQSVYVQPVFRGGGIGAKLIESLISDARTMQLDYLMTHPSTTSFDFYRRLGFDAADRALELRFID
ncbi:MAG TPA: GNAT family N-acetyltransferase [Acidimicrobiales bacterium]|nr:GNAT family N-acetyltransferase [Acidimicrobiales bacterium]HEV3268406.1 GNAT family N-acetyltransferase [Acidimicrobiales bacterium]